jgi:ketosteroid isomerase-like protein
VTHSANLDLVRSIVAVWERGDFSATEWADPEIEFVIADGPSPARGRGVGEMTDAWREFLSAWKGYRVEVDEYRELDQARVLVLLHAAGGRGKTSGVVLGQHGGGGAGLIHVDGGKVTRLVAYFDRDRALADLGLTPDTGT